MIRYSGVFDLADDPEEALARTKAQVWAAMAVLGNSALDAAFCEELAAEAKERGPSALALIDHALGTCELVTVALAWAERNPEAVS